MTVETGEILIMMIHHKRVSVSEQKIQLIVRILKQGPCLQLLSSLSSLLPLAFVLYCEVQLFSPLLFLTFEAAAF